MSAPERISISEWRLVWLMLAGKKCQTDLEWRLLRLTQEIGEMCKSLSYWLYYDDAVYFQELKKSAGDAFAQLYMFCFVAGLNVQEVEKIGMQELCNAIKTRLPK